MDFIKVAYCVTIPILLLLAWLSRSPWKKYSINLLAVSNLLLIGNSVFLVRQLIGAYQLARQFSIDYKNLFGSVDGSFISRFIMIIFLPLLFVNKNFRKNQLFSLILSALVYSVYPVSSWNTYDLLFKIPAYLCLLCAGYALLWLLNKLPYQSPAV